jgi:lipoyl(octanoyl) transferase
MRGFAKHRVAPQGATQRGVRVMRRISPHPGATHALMPGRDLIVRDCGLVGYGAAWEAMREFTAARAPDTPDELWLLQHPPVFTLGQAARPEHLLAPGNIPVVATDRGGQVTYHGPGQVMAYTLLDLRRLEVGVRVLVERLENAVIALAAAQGIVAAGRRDAPGVYVAGAKLAALGLRVRQRGCYHGLALNVAMDLEPFSRINPCGYAGLAVTDLRTLGAATDLPAAHAALTQRLAEQFGYTGLLMRPAPEFSDVHA